jgi:hypothetical protein
MRLSGLHLLLTYQCTFECDHCFVWGSPWQNGVMSLHDLREIFRQAKETDSVTSIYFEGGEPFLYYGTLLQGVKEAVEQGFSAGIVSNAYWATSVEDALVWLKPFAGLLSDLSVSSDLFHYSEMLSRQAQNAQEAAETLGIPVGTIAIARPDTADEAGELSTQGQLPLGTSGVMYRGRAVEKLAPLVETRPWSEFTSCPHEDLSDPGRVHLDPLGNLHVCQGVLMGNLFQKPLRVICDTYNPQAHPIIGPLLAGGPAELVRTYHLPLQEQFVDACHLCYLARQALREQFPDLVGPDQVFGIF